MRFLYLTLIIFLLASCGPQESYDGLLTRPPYDKITDSIQKSPNDAGLLFRRGTLLYDNEHPTEAEQDFRKAWKLRPEEIYGLRLTKLLLEKNADSALAFLNGAVKQLPESISLRIAMARGYQAKGRVDQALGVCDEVIARYPGQLDALMLKSELLKSKGQDEASTLILELAYQFAPGDVELVHTLAFYYADAGNPKALVLADSLIKVDTRNEHAEPYFFKGVYYAAKGLNSQAIQFFDEAITHNFNYIPAYVNKAIAYYDQKKYKDALKVLQLANTVSPDEAEPYYWMAKTQEAMGNKNEAKLNYQRAYGLDKSLTEAKTAADRL